MAGSRAGSGAVLEVGDIRVWWEAGLTGYRHLLVARQCPRHPGQSRNAAACAARQPRLMPRCAVGGSQLRSVRLSCDRAAVPAAGRLLVKRTRWDFVARRAVFSSELSIRSTGVTFAAEQRRALSSGIPHAGYVVITPLLTGCRYPVAAWLDWVVSGCHRSHRHRQMFGYLVARAA